MWSVLGILKAHRDMGYCPRCDQIESAARIVRSGDHNYVTCDYCHYDEQETAYLNNPPVLITYEEIRDGIVYWRTQAGGGVWEKIMEQRPALADEILDYEKKAYEAEIAQ